ncbi:MAG: hypothetical protein V3W18_04585 [candidate division Zixibacteria bacterium]
MRKLVLILTLSLTSISYAQRQAYVVNSLAETLSFIDLETGSVENHIVTLGEAPNQAVYHGGYIYVVNSISADIMKIEPENRQIAADIYLPIGSNPYFMAFSDDYCFVTGFVSGDIYKIDLSSNEIVDETSIGGYPEGILYHDGYVYVTQTYFNPNDYSYGQGKITVLNAETLANEGQYDIGTNPQWISGSSDGDLHIVCTGNYFDIFGAVYIFDPVSRTVIDSVNIGGMPANMAISPEGIGYLAAGGWSDQGLVFAYDIESGEIINGPDNPIFSGLGVTWVAVDSLGFLYSCDMGDDTISRFTPSGELLESYGLGDGPVAMTILDDIIVNTDPEPPVLPPDDFVILSNYPNPFNSGTTIAYEISDKTLTGLRIDIFDGLGRLVKSIDPGTDAIREMVIWDGTDNSGGECPSGLYFARISIRDFGRKQANFVSSLKITLLK